MRRVAGVVGEISISSTLLVSGVIFTGSATRRPGTQRIWPPPATRGRWGRSQRGILRSTRKSWSFFAPGAPWGQKRSPGRQPRPSRGKATRSRSSRAAWGAGLGLLPGVPPGGAPGASASRPGNPPEWRRRDQGDVRREARAGARRSAVRPRPGPPANPGPAARTPPLRAPWARSSREATWGAVRVRSAAIRPAAACSTRFCSTRSSARNRGRSRANNALGHFPAHRRPGPGRLPGQKPVLLLQERLGPPDRSASGADCSAGPTRAGGPGAPGCADRPGSGCWRRCGKARHSCSSQASSTSLPTASRGRTRPSGVAGHMPFKPVRAAPRSSRSQKSSTWSSAVCPRASLW